jgi:hypothetical protein
MWRRKALGGTRSFLAQTYVWDDAEAGRVDSKVDRGREQVSIYTHYCKDGLSQGRNFIAMDMSGRCDYQD